MCLPQRQSLARQRGTWRCLHLTQRKMRQALKLAHLAQHMRDKVQLLLYLATQRLILLRLSFLRRLLRMAQLRTLACLMRHQQAT